MRRGRRQISCIGSDRRGEASVANRTMDTIRVPERLSEGGVFTEDQAKRIATTLADHLKIRAPDEAGPRRPQAELEAKLTSGLASVRNQLLAARMAAFFGIILYISSGSDLRPRAVTPAAVSSLPASPEQIAVVPGSPTWPASSLSRVRRLTTVRSASCGKRPATCEVGHMLRARPRPDSIRMGQASLWRRGPC